MFHHFFFFKQKTAYEMRISDWSSDVCSSDLIECAREAFESCDIFVFTLGLTETWRSRVDGTVFPVAPGVSGGTYDSERHEFVNLDVSEVVDDMEQFLKRLKAINPRVRSEEHTSELQSLMRISYAVFCLKKKIKEHRNLKRHMTESQTQQ